MAGTHWISGDADRRDSTLEGDILTGASEPKRGLGGQGRDQPLETVSVRELGRTLTFTFDDLMHYHGPGSPAGVANAFKVLQRAFGLLSPGVPPERRTILVRTAFRGPGARDGIEAVTRAVTDGRYRVDRTLVHAELGRLREDFVFEVSIPGAATTLALCDGFVTAEFIDLARAENRSASQERRLTELKGDLCERIMSEPAERVYREIARVRS